MSFLVLVSVLRERRLLHVLFQGGVFCPEASSKSDEYAQLIRLGDLVVGQNVRTFREILPFHLVQPAADFDDAENVRARQLVARVLSLYADQNASVILAFDRPTPAWLQGVSPWCPVPPLANDTAWTRIRDTLATAVAMKRPGHCHRRMWILHELIIYL